MIVIVANRWDDTASAAASRWAARDVGILTAQDLSTAGWRQHLGGSDADVAVIGGNRIAHQDITGVLTLLPCVFAEELIDVAPDDRRYVAAEMTSFLTFWLARLKCPVLNRPTPSCLSGPSWQAERWTHAAGRVGISVRPVRRRAGIAGSDPELALSPPPATVTVIGRRSLGDSTPDLHRQTRSLALLAGVDFLAVRFSSPEPGANFVSADVVPNLLEDSVADAVLDYLCGGPGQA
jgi:hypothetical protein